MSENDQKFEVQQKVTIKENKEGIKSGEYTIVGKHDPDAEHHMSKDIAGPWLYYLRSEDENQALYDGWTKVTHRTLLKIT